MSGLARAACWALIASTIACREEPRPDPEIPPPAEAPTPTDRLPEEVVRPDPTASVDAVQVIAASHIDERASRSPVRVRRLVFRFEIRVPWGLSRGRTEVPLPTGELTVDIAGPRMRARFSGSGFPVDEGSEVRMRIDEPGAYVVDGRGGRPVTTGRMAAWFQGGPGSRNTDILVRTFIDDEPTTIEFVCRLFGEWAGSTIHTVRRKCSAEGLPIRFVFGAYRVERTAEVWLTMPEHALRADHLELPSLRHEPSVIFHDRAMRERIRATVDVPPVRAEEPGAPTIAEGVSVENRVAARTLVAVSGVPIGWLDPGESAHFDGIAPGGYVISALLPLGSTASVSKAYQLPRYVVLRPRVE